MQLHPEIAQLLNSGVSSTIREFFSPAEVQSIRSELLLKPLDTKSYGTYNVSGSYLAEPHPAVRNAVHRIAELLYSYNLRDVRLILGVAVPKLLNEGCRPLHVDWWNWDNLKDTCREIPPQIGALCYLDEAAYDTGSLIYVPHSHRMQIDEHLRYWETNKCHPDEVMISANLGDVILLDARTLHAVTANTRIENRMLMTLWFLLGYDNLTDETKQMAHNSVPHSYREHFSDLCPDIPKTQSYTIGTKKPQFPFVYERIDALRNGYTDKELLDGSIHASDLDWIGGHETYSWYFAVAAACGARNIVETGVRYGYSAIAMLRGAEWAGVRDFRYIGIDGEIDGVASNDIALRNLKASFLFQIQPEILLLNTSRNTASVNAALSERCYADLFHIDGDHSSQGIVNELTIAEQWIKPSGIILVDDIDTPCVKEAADKFSESYGIVPILLPTQHGMYALDMNRRTKFQ